VCALSYQEVLNTERFAKIDFPYPSHPTTKQIGMFDTIKR